MLIMRISILLLIGRWIKMEQNWTTIIKPKTKLLDLRLGELWQYKDLIWLFVKRDFKTIYKQTILGPLWIIINPLLTTMIQMLVFGNIAGLSTDGTPQFIFYLSGNAVWLYFSGCFTKNANTFISNSAVFGKVYFPRLVTPISVIISGLVTFLVQFAVLAIGLIYFYTKGEVEPNYYMLLIPVLVLELALLSMGCGIIISALTTKYRDLSILVTFGVQLWMYGSAIIFPASSLPEKLMKIMMLNPVVPIVETFRYSVTGNGIVPLDYLLISMIETMCVLIIGMITFNRVEKTFMDTV